MIVIASHKDPFFGRERELQILMDLRSKRTASLVVIKGRRRVGKSRLAEEFLKTMKSYIFVGLAPEQKVTVQMQRDDFAKQLQRQFNIPGLKTDDWGDLFWHLANQIQTGRVCILLDEINWMGDLDPTFLPKLKSAWELYFKKNPELIMILSGSMSRWIEENILSSTGFFGRLSLEITLEELPLSVCNEFWGAQKELVSPYEKFKILSITGGIPRYLEEIHPEWTAEKNIMSLCYHRESILYKEFDRIFLDLFAKRSGSYKKIVSACVGHNTTLNDISAALEMKKGGTVSDYVDDLVKTGYLSRDETWNLTSKEYSKLGVYRLKDNYIRFYLKYIEPLSQKIERNEIVRPPAWDTIMGLQFENLVLNNRKAIKSLLSLMPDDIVIDNPYFQNKTTRHAGCQIDYMIQTKYNSLHVCEIKFSINPIGTEVIDQVKQKIAALNASKRFSVWPVLIHVNGVTQGVIDAGFFSRIIDFSELL